MHNHTTIKLKSADTVTVVVKRHGPRPLPPPNIIMTLIFPQGLWTNPLKRLFCKVDVAKIFTISFINDPIINIRNFPFRNESIS